MVCDPAEPCGAHCGGKPVQGAAHRRVQVSLGLDLVVGVALLMGMYLSAGVFVEAAAFDDYFLVHLYASIYEFASGCISYIWPFALPARVDWSRFPRCDEVATTSGHGVAGIPGTLPRALPPSRLRAQGGAPSTCADCLSPQYSPACSRECRRCNHPLVAWRSVEKVSVQTGALDVEIRALAWQPAAVRCRLLPPPGISPVGLVTATGLRVEPWAPRRCMFDLVSFAAPRNCVRHSPYLQVSALRLLH